MVVPRCTPFPIPEGGRLYTTWFVQLYTPSQWSYRLYSKLYMNQSHVYQSVLLLPNQNRGCTQVHLYIYIPPSHWSNRLYTRLNNCCTKVYAFSHSRGREAVHNLICTTRYPLRIGAIGCITGWIMVIPRCTPFPVPEGVRLYTTLFVQLYTPSQWSYRLYSKL